MRKEVGNKAKHKRINVRGIGSTHDGEHQNERNNKTWHCREHRKNRREYDLNYYDDNRKDKRKHPITHGRYSPSSEEELEEELSKTKFDLFEKQKETLSLKKEKEELENQGNALKEELDGVNKKMNGILSVLQGNNKD